MPKYESKLPRWVQSTIVSAGRSITTPLQCVGLGAATSGAIALANLYPRLQPRRFERAVENLRFAFPDWSEDQVQACARGCYQHLFRLGVELLYIPRLINPDGFSNHLHFGDITPAMKQLLSNRPCILISGHVGNWELIGFAISMLGFPMHAVYRPIDLKPLDEWVREARARRGLVLVSKFGAVKTMPEVLKAGQPVGLVADQSGGDRGIFAPFFGRLTSTYKSIGLLAMQTNARIMCGVARRVADGATPDSNSRWLPQERGEQWGSGPSQGLSYAVDMIDDFGPEDWEDQPDRLFYITARYRRAIETMIRRSPDQYLWMHRIWRSRPAHERLGKPFPGALKDKLLALPWMTQAEVDALVAQSDRDTVAGNVGKREGTRD